MVLDRAKISYRIIRTLKILNFPFLQFSNSIKMANIDNPNPQIFERKEAFSKQFYKDRLSNELNMDIEDPIDELEGT